MTANVISVPTVRVRAPSNIAFLKYWGKLNATSQVPANSSLSMTLSNCATITTARPLVSHANHDVIRFNHEPLPSGSEALRRITKHLDLLRSITQNDAYLEIETENLFPSDCGIASSASGFAALTLAGLGALGNATSEDEFWKSYSREQVANIARLGSGSACRSLWGGFVLWEAPPELESPELNSENGHLQKVSRPFSADHWPLSDIIAIVSTEKKPVDSRTAHKAAWTSPFFRPRLAGIPDRLEYMQHAIAQKDLDKLGTWLEVEALEMHAVMMTATPAAKYPTEKTIEIMTWLREQRRQHRIRAYFTLDAGPNVHMVCETSQEELLINSLKREFPDLAFIADHVGNGPNLSWN